MKKFKEFLTKDYLTSFLVAAIMPGGLIVLLAVLIYKGYKQDLKDRNKKGINEENNVL